LVALKPPKLNFGALAPALAPPVAEFIPSNGALKFVGEAVEGGFVSATLKGDEDVAGAIVVAGFAKLNFKPFDGAVVAAAAAVAGLD
jgi:hypothetical protein